MSTIRPRTAYALTPEGLYLAYQTLGDGPMTFVWLADAFFANVDSWWDAEPMGSWLRGVAGFCRVVVHDRRSTGHSSRGVPAPSLETAAADLLVVLDAIGAHGPVVIGGFAQGGAMAVMLAATHPDRVHSIFWISPTARALATSDYPWGYTPDDVAAEARVTAAWGTDAYGPLFLAQEAATGHQIPSELASHMSGVSRRTCTPDVANVITRIWYETDVRAALPAVHAPVILVHDRSNGNAPAEGEYIAALMPAARVVQSDTAEGDHTADLIRELMGMERPATALDRVLATVLFTDIVDSTSRAALLGDGAWRELRTRHDELVRNELARHRGHEIKTMGDGFLATFDGPSRAVRCAIAITGAMADLGIEVRAGLHTGEIELAGGDISGIAVAIGARVGAVAGPSEVLVSQTIKDLTAGSGIHYDDRGDHELKGLPDRWRLYAASV